CNVANGSNTRRARVHEIARGRRPACESPTVRSQAPSDRRRGPRVVTSRARRRERPGPSAWRERPWSRSLPRVVRALGSELRPSVLDSLAGVSRSYQSYRSHHRAAPGVPPDIALEASMRRVALSFLLMSSAATGAPTSSAPSTAVVHQLAADAAGLFANSYLVETKNGVVVIDGRLLT